MIIQSVWQKSFDFFGKPVVVRPSEAELTSDAGLLPIREFDQRIGLTEQFAAALTDLRYQPSIAHTLREMVRVRIFGILADYPDQNDHDVLRNDPIFKILAGRSPEGDDLASQPTLSRFENAIDVKSLGRLQEVLVDQFIASFDEPPTRITLDIDPFDDPTHGQQQLTFFHGYYQQYQYLSRVITCAENDLVVMLCLLFGTAHAALGAGDDLAYLVGRLRDAFPGVRIILRADSGFGVPAMYAACERLEIDFTIGIGMNATLKTRSDALLQHVVERFEATGEPQREFRAFWYQAGSWPAARWVIVKCEANAQGTNRRAVVT
ncbi:MAG: IS1380 family transposase, partial [Phycisphaerae bacterium]|nr:IS1380 family transposase [Phycisphaerae bacterium]